MRLVRPASPRRSLVLDDELGWDRTPSVENPIPSPRRRSQARNRFALFAAAEHDCGRYTAPGCAAASRSQIRRISGMQSGQLLLIRATRGIKLVTAPANSRLVNL